MERDYTAFVEEVGERLRLALLSAYGPEAGAEATAETLGYAWEHWDRIGAMSNPAGYLYRVGQSRARRYRRRPVRLPAPIEASEPLVEPGLVGALEHLPERQRVSVLLVHGYGWTLRETADLLGIRRSTVQRHVERGLQSLRSALEVRIEH